MKNVQPIRAIQILMVISRFAPSLRDSGALLCWIPSVGQSVTKTSAGAEIILFRPLKRAGDVLTSPQPQSRDWGYPVPPADAG